MSLTTLWRLGEAAAMGGICCATLLIEEGQGAVAWRFKPLHFEAKQPAQTGNRRGDGRGPHPCRGSFGLLALILAGLLLSGCSKKSKENERLEKALNALEGRAGETRSETTLPSQVPLHYRAYMDFSESMKPYVHPQANQGAFRLLLTQFRDLDTNLVKWYGFGSRKDAKTPEQPPADVSSLKEFADYRLYNRLNNDYAALIRTFGKEKAAGEQRVVISDGVNSPSKTAMGSSLGETAAAINQYIDTHHAFGLYLFRTAYYCRPPAEFSYFSETLKAQDPKRSRVTLDTPNRPFVMFAFPTSAEALDVLRHEIVDPVAAGERWALEIKPAIQTSAFTVALEPGPKLNKIKSHSLSNLADPLPEYHWVQSSKCQLNFRLGVDNTVPTGLARNRLQEQIEQGTLRISLQVVDLPHRSSAVAPARTLQPDFDRAKLKEGVLSISVPSPPLTHRRLWYLKVEPAASTPPSEYATDLANWSTPDDSSATNQDKILNLQNLVREITKGRAQGTMRGTEAVLLTD